MTRNRTGLAIFSTLSPELIFVVILTLALFLAVSRYFWLAGDERRRIDVKVRRRALRRLAA
jgi:hypothetical protein